MLGAAVSVSQNFSASELMGFVTRLFFAVKDIL